MQAVNNTRPIQYSGRSPERKEAEKQVVTGGGAIAATTAAANVKATKSGIDMFTSGAKQATTALKTTGEVAKKTSGLWSKVVKSVKWATDAVMNWGSKFRGMKFIKPLVDSRLFRYCAGGLGYAFGAITLISGLADICRVTSEKLVSKLPE